MVKLRPECISRSFQHWIIPVFYWGHFAGYNAMLAVHSWRCRKQISPGTRPLITIKSLPFHCRQSMRKPCKPRRVAFSRRYSPFRQVLSRFSPWISSQVYLYFMFCGASWYAWISLIGSMPHNNLDAVPLDLKASQSWLAKCRGWNEVQR